MCGGTPCVWRGDLFLVRLSEGFSGFSGFALSMTYGTKAAFGELGIVGGVCVRWALKSAGVSCETV